MTDEIQIGKRIGPLFVSWGHGRWWFRLFGRWGLAYKDSRMHGLRFSERYGYGRLWWRVGRHVLRVLR